MYNAITLLVSLIVAFLILCILSIGNVTDEFKDILGKVAGSMVTTVSEISDVNQCQRMEIETHAIIFYFASMNHSKLPCG